MAKYSMPELLLVGAAQNIVLNTSLEAKPPGGGDEPCINEVDDNLNDYVFEPAW